VLRSQLSLKNEFYPDIPADKNIEIDEIPPAVNTCRVCSCRGPMLCGRCKKVSYCGQSHQKLDWKIHKQFCDQENHIEKVPLSEILFPEYEIDIEEEEPLDDEKKETEKEAEERRMKEYEALVKEGKAGAMMDCSDKDLDDFAESKEDKTFGKFKKNVAGYETQVIRYNRHGNPLWISDNGKLNLGFVPNCENCGSKRSYEFQIMPQMLNELKNYDLDWGIIAIFTCENDCDIKGKYVREFCYKQDVVQTEESGNEVDMEKLKIAEKFQPKTTQTNETNNKNDKKKSSTMKTQEKSKKAQKPQKKAFDDCDNWE
jgi:pre-rRNA-processing protein TSR4